MSSRDDRERKILDQANAILDKIGPGQDNLHDRITELFRRFDKVEGRLGECYCDGREWCVHERLSEILGRVGKCYWENREWSVHERLSEMFEHFKTLEMLLNGDVGAYAKSYAQERFDSILTKMERWLDIVCPDSNQVERLEVQYARYINGIAEQEKRLKDFMASLEETRQNVDSLLPAVEKKMAALAEKEHDLLQQELVMAEKKAQLEKEQPAQMREMHAEILKFKAKLKQQAEELAQQEAEVNRQRQENAAMKGDLDVLKKLCRANNIELPHRLEQYK